MSQEVSGDAPGGVGLLIVDMVNDLQFAGSHQLRAAALDVAHTLRRLRDEADRLGVPVIYVNDNYGQWLSDRAAIVDHCRTASPQSAQLIDLVGPRDQDYFVVKPQFSGFYATNLPAVLPRLGVNRLVLGGVAADICVLFTAADAHMREYGLWVPADAIGSDRDEHKDWALGIMDKSMSAETRPTTSLSLQAWMAGAQQS